MFQTRIAYAFVLVLIAGLILMPDAALADWGSDLAAKLDTAQGWLVTIGWAVIGVSAVIIIIAFVVGQRPFMWLGIWAVACMSLATVDGLITAFK